MGNELDPPFDPRRDHHLPRIEADVQSGKRSGVTGTPGLFVDGERYTGFYDVESLHEALEDAAAAAFARRPRR